MEKSILVVDDESELVELMKMGLEANGYQVITASDGKAGLETAVREKPDLILLDLMMPEMDGYEVLRRLRRLPAMRAIPVIMLTAKRDTRSILLTQELRATDYFIKPFESDALLACISKHRCSLQSPGAD